MAEPKSIFEETDADVEARAIAKAEAEIDASKGVPDVKVRERLLKLAKDEIPRASNLVGRALCEPGRSRNDRAEHFEITETREQQS